jgi:NAD(P)-dependent dehydrogenase (short-subunit alcohol dehydrogenase family)
VKAFDAASAPSIRALARACAAELPRIDVLVNNAGVARGSGTSRATASS